MNCSVYVRPFVVVAERDGDTLILLRNEAAREGGHDGGKAAAWLGAFAKLRADPGWPGCHYCHAIENAVMDIRGCWMCEACATRHRPALNCAGSDSQGRFRCACGVVAMDFIAAERVQVFGAPDAPRLAAAAAKLLPASLGRRLLKGGS